jgi:hypothetical protein
MHCVGRRKQRIEAKCQSPGRKPATGQEGKFGLPERLPDNGHSCFALAWFGQMLIGAEVKRSPK